MSQQTMAALGELICRLNPYTQLPKDPTTALCTGEMEAKLFEQFPNAPDGDPNNYPVGEPNNTLACMGVEVERNYNTQWTFKGQQQTVKLAFRIPYRFPVKRIDDDGNAKTLYWQTEYLIVGYAGADGGG
jgi:hypothetical protein